MAKYTLTATVDFHRVDSLKKMLKEIFGAEAFAVEKLEGPGTREKRFTEAMGKVEDAISEIQELKGEMDDWLESIPENLKEGEKAGEIQECIDALDELISSLENVQGTDVSFPSMMG